MIELDRTLNQPTLPDIPRRNISQLVRFVFYGSEKHWNHFRLNCKRLSLCQVSIDRIRAWAFVLKRTSPLYKRINLDLFETISNEAFRDEVISSVIDNMDPVHDELARHVDEIAQVDPTGVGFQDPLVRTDIEAESKGYTSSDFPMQYVLLRQDPEAISENPDARTEQFIRAVRTLFGNESVPEKETTKPAPQADVYLRASRPLNEFTENDRILQGSFPTTFFMCRNLPSKPFNLRWRRCLLLSYKPVHDRRVHIWLANSAMRHEVTSKVTAHIKNAETSISAVEEVVQDKGLKFLLADALQDLTGTILDFHLRWQDYINRL
jgi:hypothetical protein